MADLTQRLDGFAEVGDFFARDLDYNHPSREATLRGVVDFLIRETAHHPGSSEWERLQAWAQDACPGDYLTVGVKGFGLAGFQYLRMLFGVQTTKPDVHIKRFVSETVGREVDDATALRLLEAATKTARLPLREVDNAIWVVGARGGAQPSS